MVRFSNNTHAHSRYEADYAPPSQERPRLAPHPRNRFDPAIRDDGNGDCDITAGSPTSARNSIYSTRSSPNGDDSRLPISPIMFKRRATRVATTLSNGTTVRTVNTSPSNEDWHPGQEPGLDPSKKNGGRQQAPVVHEVCQITVVDFSEDDMEMRDFDNQGLIAFIAKPQENWIKCRWINVNGISWDVIQALGAAKKLHRLAIEDLINTNNRTKVDWQVDSVLAIHAANLLAGIPTILS